jgi:hypothetical protein
MISQNRPAFPKALPFLCQCFSAEKPTALKNNDLGSVAAVIFGWLGSNQHPAAIDGYLQNVCF